MSDGPFADSSSGGRTASSARGQGARARRERGASSAARGGRGRPTATASDGDPADVTAILLQETLRQARSAILTATALPQQAGGSTGGPGVDLRALRKGEMHKLELMLNQKSTPKQDHETFILSQHSTEFREKALSLIAQLDPERHARRITLIRMLLSFPADGGPEQIVPTEVPDHMKTMFRDLCLQGLQDLPLEKRARDIAIAKARFHAMQQVANAWDQDSPRTAQAEVNDAVATTTLIDLLANGVLCKPHIAIFSRLYRNDANFRERVLDHRQAYIDQGDELRASRMSHRIDLVEGLGGPQGGHDDQAATDAEAGPSSSPSRARTAGTRPSTTTSPRDGRGRPVRGQRAAEGLSQEGSEDDLIGLVAKAQQTPEQLERFSRRWQRSPGFQQRADDRLEMLASQGDSQGVMELGFHIGRLRHKNPVLGVPQRVWPYVQHAFEMTEEYLRNRDPSPTGPSRDEGLRAFLEETVASRATMAAHLQAQGLPVPPGWARAEEGGDGGHSGGARASRQGGGLGRGGGGDSGQSGLAQRGRGGRGGGGRGGGRGGRGRR